jgi:hypothetical protein
MGVMISLFRLEYIVALRVENAIGNLKKCHPHFSLRWWAGLWDKDPREELNL